MFGMLLLLAGGLHFARLEAQPPPRYYLMTDIGPGGAEEIKAAGATLSGSTVGSYSGNPGCSSSVARSGFFLSNDWRLFPLCPVSGDVESTAWAIETMGTASAVGSSISAGGLERPVQWNRQTDGTFLPGLIKLPFGSPQGIAYGTEDYSRLTGTIESGGLRVPSYWPSAGATPTLFPFSGAGEGTTIRGNTSEVLIAGTHGGRFFLWYPGRPSPNNLQFPLGTITSFPKSLRWTADPPIVAGAMTLPQGVRGFVWRGTLPEQQLGTLGGSLSEAWDILPTTDQIVGGANDAQEIRRAVLWEGGNLYDLNQAVLPTCRPGDPSLCASTLLQNANGIASNGNIVGQALVDSNPHAFLLRPVGPYTWTLGACAGVGTPYCTALSSPVYSSSSPFSAPIYRATSTATGDARSAVTTQAARALASTSSRNLLAEAQFQNFLVLENLSLAKLLASGSSTVRVVFHFKVEASVGRCNGSQQTGGVNVSLLVRSAKGAGYLASGSGSIQFLGTGAFNGYGIFSTHPTGGSFEVALPVNLSPRSLVVDSLELRLEGRATADAFAINNTGSCASGDITVQFCSDDPAAITLEDGTPLATLGVRYANWPTLSPSPGCAGVPL
jgi:hypothetical protein